MTQAFNLSQFANKVNTSGLADLTTAVTGTLPVANGGTGVATLSANNVILGNGTSAVQVVAPSTSGNVLMSNGTTWASQPSGAYAGINLVTFTSSGSWTCPAGITKIFVRVVGGGGGGGAAQYSGSIGGGGGAGGTITSYITTASGTYTITIGTAGVGATSTGVNGTAGSSSSFGSAVSATGGGGGTSSATGSAGAGGTAGTGTISIGIVTNGGWTSGGGTLGNGGASAPSPLGAFIAGNNGNNGVVYITY